MKNCKDLVTKLPQGLCFKISFALFLTSILLIWFSFTFKDSSTTFAENEITEEYLTINTKISNKHKNGANGHNNSTKRSGFDVKDIKKRIAAINREEKIHNGDVFGPLQNDSLVIVVQVHTRISYLKYLIASLRVATGISKVLLVFSHDYFDDDINTLIQTIDFCKVIQFFYPHSLQVYANEFPGASRNHAITKLCKNPNGETENRRPSYVQVKHHWWWKANRVFHLSALHRYDGLFLFLEDDLYLVEDFIPMLGLMQSTARDRCSKCKILSLAQNRDAVNFEQANFSKSREALVTSKFSNMGLSFNRATWNEMVDCRNEFCNYNDYNWDYSLQHVFTTCMEKASAMTLSAPRAIHLGKCGLHFRSEDCDASETISKVRKKLAGAKKTLYPKKLILSFSVDSKKIPKGYGGWGDPRDHAFCLGMTIV